MLYLRFMAVGNKPWFPKKGDPSTFVTAYEFNQLIEAIQNLTGLGSGDCNLLRVCGTPVNNGIPIWSTTTGRAEWGVSPTAWLGLADTPASYATYAGYGIRVNGLETGLEFYAIAAAVTAFTGLTDTPANYTGHGLKVVRVNAGETALEFFAGGTGDVVGPAGATDDTLARWDGATGKLLKDGLAYSEGGNDVADAGKVLIFDANGGIMGRSGGSKAGVTGEGIATTVGGRFTSQTYAGVEGWGTGAGSYGAYLHGQLYGLYAENDASAGYAGYLLSHNDAGSYALYARSGDGSNTADIGRFMNRTETAGLYISNSGGLSWLGATGLNETITALGLGAFAFLNNPEFADNVFRIQDNADNTKELAFEVSAITTATTRTVTMPDRNIDLDFSDRFELIIALSDETTALTTGTAVVTFRMPRAVILTEVRASVTEAPVGSIITVDIDESGSTIFSTLLTIDATEKTSTTAATPSVISDPNIADDAEIKIHVTTVGSTSPGKGLKVAFIGNYAP